MTTKQPAPRKHTPGLPESLERDNIDNATVYECSRGGSSVAFTVNLYLAVPGENEALAAEIVRRWNSFEEMRAALTESLAALNLAFGLLDRIDGDPLEGSEDGPRILAREGAASTVDAVRNAARLTHALLAKVSG